MTDLMALVDVSAASVGTALHLDRLVSTDAGLAPLARGGRLYLVGLRPPPEQLWLAGILVDPVFDGTQWSSTASELPVIDITELRSKFQFTSGTGWTDWCDSCQQTHRSGTAPWSLTAGDAALLDGAAGGSRASTPEASVGSGRRHGALLDAIVEHPASDEARRVYADQLLTNGDLRGELILLDLALAGPLSMRNREKLAARRAHLLAGYGAIWWPYTVERKEIQKGFLRAVHGTWTQIQAIAPELFACEPVTEVGIRAPVVDELLAAPWLSRVERLVLRGLADLSIASAPQLAKLRALNVSGNNLTSLPELALPRVENLVLTGNPIGGDLEALHAWDQLANVTTLYLSSCELDGAGLELLLQRRLDKLSMLALSFNDLGDDVGVLAEHARQLPALRHLELKVCSITESGVRSLVRAFPNLRRLDVRRNRLEPDLASRIVVC